MRAVSEDVKDFSSELVVVVQPSSVLRSFGSSSCAHGDGVGRSSKPCVSCKVFVTQYTETPIRHRLRSSAILAKRADDLNEMPNSPFTRHMWKSRRNVAAEDTDASVHSTCMVSNYSRYSGHEQVQVNPCM